MKIGLDVMGGDFAPNSNLDGAILALNEIGDQDSIVLFGDKAIIESGLIERGVSTSSFEIIACSQAVGMDEKPLKALSEKPDSSLVKAFTALAKSEIDAVASAGNSGAVVAGAMIIVKNIPGITRPCSIAQIPQEDGGFSLLVDVGTTPDAKTEVLYQFAMIANIFAKYVYQIDSPRVSLLNIGTEAEKGNLQCQAAFRLMKESQDFNFVGNLEPRDLFKNKADIFVVDGFVGNIVLKQIETFYSLFEEKCIGKTDPFITQLNYEILGGSPIVGLNAPVVLGHGISSPLAIKNMLLLCKRMHDQKMVEKLTHLFAENAKNNL